MKSVVLVACLFFSSALGLDEDRGARVIAAYSTRTVLTLTTITSTQPYTCANYFGVANCQKRRFRRYKNLDRDFGTDDDTTLLDSSILEAEPRSLDLKENAREGRIALTVWSSSTSTFTVTSTSINSSTTYSLSFFCTAGGAAFPPACAG